jgi:hypothetical protein
MMMTKHLKLFNLIITFRDYMVSLPGALKGEKWKKAEE